MKELVDTKEMQEVGRDAVSGDTTFVFPKQSIEVVCLTQDCVFPYIKGLDKSIRVQQYACEL